MGVRFPARIAIVLSLPLSDRLWDLASLLSNDVKEDGTRS